MTATQIFRQKLTKTDEQILASLPSTPRIACCQCNLISVRKRPSYDETSLCFCLKCRREVKTRVTNYYPTHISTLPALVVHRYKNFWKRAYYTQLSLERMAWYNQEQARRAHEQAHLNSLRIAAQPRRDVALKLTRWTGALGL